MYHVAIMNKSWKLIPKIISGEKTIESRWYQTKRIPWNHINKEDVIFFKNSGEPIIAKAEVEKVIQFEIKNINDIKDIIKKYGDEICIVNKNLEVWNQKIKYCILIYLKNSKYIDKFNINKTGFGIGCAWISVNDINNIKINNDI